MNDKLKERIERYKEGKPSESTVKTRKFSRILVFINIALLLIILFYAKKPHDISYFSTRIVHNDLDYKISAAKNEKNKNLILSFTIKSTNSAGRTYYFNRSIASIGLYYDKELLCEVPVGENNPVITLAPHEIKNYVKIIDQTGLKRFCEDHPEFIKPRRKSYLFAEKQHLPLEMRITINVKEPISSILDFYYEVE